MKTRSIIPVTALLLLLSGCNPSHHTADNDDGSQPYQVCEKSCEKDPTIDAYITKNFHPVQLEPSESNSLTQALNDGKKTPGAPVLKGSVVNGKVVFGSAPNPGSAPEPTAVISVPGQKSPVKVLLTPEASQILHQRISK